MKWNRLILCSVFSAGAYQVKWNRVTNNLFATTHEGDIRIWDPRVRRTGEEEGVGGTQGVREEMGVGVCKQKDKWRERWNREEQGRRGREIICVHVIKIYLLFRLMCLCCVLEMGNLAYGGALGQPDQTLTTSDTL